MAYEIPNSEPAQIRAGDRIKWRKSLSQYPANEGWVLSYRLINAAGKIDITATADGALHLVDVSTDDSGEYTAGDYTWVSSITSGDERYTLEQGSIKVLPDLAAEAAGYDTRSLAKKTLDLLDAALLEHGSQAWTQQYAFNNRTVTFRTPDEFMNMRSRLQREVKAEENANNMSQGLGSKNKVQVRF